MSDWTPRTKSTQEAMRMRLGAFNRCTPDLNLRLGSTLFLAEHMTNTPIAEPYSESPTQQTITPVKTATLHNAIHVLRLQHLSMQARP